MGLPAIKKPRPIQIGESNKIAHPPISPFSAKGCLIDKLEKKRLLFQGDPDNLKDNFAISGKGGAMYSFFSPNQLAEILNIRDMLPNPEIHPDMFNGMAHLVKQRLIAMQLLLANNVTHGARLADPNTSLINALATENISMAKTCVFGYDMCGSTEAQAKMEFLVNFIMKLMEEHPQLANDKRIQKYLATLGRRLTTVKYLFHESMVAFFRALYIFDFIIPGDCVLGMYMDYSFIRRWNSNSITFKGRKPFIAKPDAESSFRSIIAAALFVRLLSIGYNRVLSSLDLNSMFRSLKFEDFLDSLRSKMKITNNEYDGMALEFAGLMNLEPLKKIGWQFKFLTRQFAGYDIAHILGKVGSQNFNVDGNQLNFLCKFMDEKKIIGEIPLPILVVTKKTYDSMPKNLQMLFTEKEVDIGAVSFHLTLLAENITVPSMLSEILAGKDSIQMEKNRLVYCILPENVPGMENIIDKLGPNDFT